MQGRRLREVPAFPAAQQLQQELDALSLSPGRRQLIQAALPVLPESTPIRQQAVSNIERSDNRQTGDELDAPDEVEDSVVQDSTAQSSLLGNLPVPAHTGSGSSKQVSMSDEVSYGCHQSGSGSRKHRPKRQGAIDEPWLTIAAAGDCMAGFVVRTPQPTLGLSEPAWLAGCIRHRKPDAKFAC